MRSQGSDQKPGPPLQRQTEQWVQAHIKQSGLMSDTRVNQVQSAIRLGLFSLADYANIAP